MVRGTAHLRRTAGRGGRGGGRLSADGGDSWTVAGATFAWELAFTDNRIWAGTNQGLLASSDGGRTWEDVVVTDDYIRDQLQLSLIHI